MPRPDDAFLSTHPVFRFMWSPIGQVLAWALLTATALLAFWLYGLIPALVIAAIGGVGAQAIEVFRGRYPHR